jgi:hypothetical protein
VSGPPETSPGAAPGHPSAPADPRAHGTATSSWTDPAGHSPDQATAGHAPDRARTGHAPDPAPAGHAPDRAPAGHTPDRSRGQHRAGSGADPAASSPAWPMDGSATPGAAAGPYPAPPGGFGGAYGGPVVKAAKVEPPSRVEWVTAAAVVGVLAVLGAALAPLWVQLAPRLAFRVDRPGRALPVVPEAEEYIGADGRFVILTLAAGVLAGLACWLVRRSRGPLVLLALAVGGLAGALVTWWLGTRIGTGYQPADLQQVGKIIYQPLVLRAKSALVVEPVAAVLVYLLAVGFTARNDLGRSRVSSGSG